MIANARHHPQLFPPLCAPGRPLSHVDFLVPPQILLQPVPFPTHHAFISPAPGVQRLVSDKVLLLREAFPALGAFARPHPDVDRLVPEEVGFLIEGLLAFGTFVRLLPGVNPLVPHEVRPLGEAFPTLGTFKGLAHMDSLMPDELSVHPEALPTFIALIRPFTGVDLPVPSKIRLLIEAFPALGTGKYSLCFGTLLRQGTFLAFCVCLSVWT